jgi:hypothetical protein
MKKRTLGTLEVSEIGYGTMSFASSYGSAPPHAEAIVTLRRAVDLGVNEAVVRQITVVLRRYHEAMVAASTDRLREIVAERFTLTHVTGYLQPAKEWFSVIETGEFSYHYIDIDEPSFKVSARGKYAIVQGNGIFNATIYGMKRPWPLGFDLELRYEEQGWMITQARYTLL